MCCTSDDLAHLLVLALHTLEELVLGVGADQVVVWVGCLVVPVSVDVVHQETEDLLEGDISCGECKPVQFALCH